MTQAEQLAVRVTATGLPPHDSFGMYERLRAVHGHEDVFLFESADGAEPDRRWAAVGHGRLAEIRVYAGHVEIDGVPGVLGQLLGAARGTGLVAEPPGGGPGHRFRLTGGDQVWELAARAQSRFAVTTDVPAHRFAFGFLTSLAYEAVWHMEALPDRGAAPGGPDVTLTLFRDTVWYDLTSGEVQLLRAESAAFPARRAGGGEAVTAAVAEAVAPPGGVAVPAAPVPRSVTDSVSRETFLGWARRCLEHIRVGDVYQIQIGHRLDVVTELTPLDVYRRLRARNPSPYMYLMPRAGRTLIGASPELFFRIEGDGIVMRPIAGTARRGADEEENRLRVKEMRESTKERAEHVMLVDLCRNDIGRVSRPSTQPVDRLMAVERYSHVFHLVSTVSGRLAESVSTWDAVRATFPAGTMTGAPKVRAMEIIDGLERERRGSYAGAVGLVDVRGWSEFALCIRTVEYDGTTYSTQSSAGMVAQSDPEAEWRETLLKMGAAHWALTGEELLP
ncbi:anthranilate synthase component I family protein [Streptomyces catenulae]|uniref:Anthranilate synthase component I family protein n=1 Tax=Streptomyces catenulae TaxID=66875 RepID=A0ABV2Z3S9_9ACTN|nr:anthranilate synthase component I family protein [Streptomyces catenulae]